MLAQIFLATGCLLAIPAGWLAGRDTPGWRNDVRMDTQSYSVGQQDTFSPIYRSDRAAAGLAGLFTGGAGLAGFIALVAVFLVLFARPTNDEMVRMPGWLATAFMHKFWYFAGAGLLGYVLSVLTYKRPASREEPAPYED